MTEQDTFELTTELIRLLRASNVSDRLEGAYGAAAVDSKRPYGSSGVIEDITRIIGLPVNDDGEPTAESWTRAHLLHEQTPLALQVVLSSGSFQTGVYQRTTPYGSEWVLKTPTDGYATLVEHNEHEGETWRFYIPTAGNEDALTELKDALDRREDEDEDEPRYELNLETLVPGSHVDVLVDHAGGGYMADHNKLEGYLVLTPEVLEQITESDDDDPLYKGSIRELMRKYPV